MAGALRDRRPRHKADTYDVEGVFYNESAYNSSDLSTRATATIDELVPDRVHQTGLTFFSSEKKLLCAPFSVGLSVKKKIKKLLTLGFQRNGGNKSCFYI